MNFNTDVGRHAYYGGSNSRNYRGHSYEERWNGAVVDRFPNVVGPQARLGQSPTVTGEVRYRTYKQPMNENERDANYDDGPRIAECVSLRIVEQGDTPPSPDPLLKPSRIVRGTNRRGNRFHGEYYPDGTNPYQYENRDGTRYEKHRDGSADLHFNRGLMKHYPAPAVDGPVRREQYEYDVGEVGGLPQGHPIASRKVPATRREDIRQPDPELDDSTVNWIGGGHKQHRKSQPTRNRQTPLPPSSSSSSSSSSSPSPPPAPQSSRKSKMRRSTKSRKQDSAAEARRTY